MRRHASSCAPPTRFSHGLGQKRSSFATQQFSVAEVWHIKEPQKLPPVLSPEEVKRVLTLATSLKARAMLTLAYGCGPRAGDIDNEQTIIRIVQSKGRKDRHVMLPAEVLDLLRQWWKV
jgi:integrase/recombinase XerD